MDDCALLAVLVHHRRQRARERYWIHPINQLRFEYGEFHRLVQEMKYHDPWFREYFWMDKDQYEDLLHRIAPQITKKDTNWCGSIQPEERLAVTLR